MTEKQRNELLVEMTDAVAEQVLYSSYTQTQAMSLALAQAAQMIDVHARLIRHLEQDAGLDREIEFLPSDETINERKVDHQGLVAPELAVVMAYCKIRLFTRLLESDLPEDEYLAHDLERYFPPPLPERYSRADAKPPPAPRDHRHGRRQPARRPGGHDVRLPARRGDRRPAVARSPAATRWRARCSTCARSGPRSRPSTTWSRRAPSSRC